MKMYDLSANVCDYLFEDPNPPTRCQLTHTVAAILKLILFLLDDSASGIMPIKRFILYWKIMKLKIV